MLSNAYLFLSFLAGCVFLWLAIFIFPEAVSSLARHLTWTGREPLAEKLFKLRLFLSYPAERVLALCGVPPAVCPLMTARGELSTCLMMLGKFDEAVQIQRHNCDELVKLEKDAHYASSLARLAENLRYLGDLQEAERMSREALTVAQSCYHRMNPEADGYEQMMNNATISLFCEVLFSRANLMQAVERLQEARELREKALSLINETFGQKESMLTCYGMMLGDTYIKLEQYDKATPLITGALEVRRKQLPRDHALLISGENKLGKLYCSQGLLNEAEPLLLSAYRLTKSWNVDSAEHLADLALLRCKQGKSAEALQLYDQALKKYEQFFGTDNPILLDVLGDYAKALDLAGDSGKAGVLQERVSALRKKLNINGSKDSQNQTFG